MGRLVVVRHGQASIHADDYDQLSELGGHQSSALGQHWASMGSCWDGAVIGPCKRHRQTAEAVASQYQNHGQEFPSFSEHPAFDEHHGVRVFQEVLAADVANGKESGIASTKVTDPKAIENFMAQFRAVTRSWVLGEFDYPQHENWQAFRQRVIAGIGEVLGQFKNGDQVVLFSSAGPLAVLTGFSLGLDDVAMLDLSWRVRNSAVAEFRFDGATITLESFNALPHVRDPKLLTMV